MSRSVPDAPRTPRCHRCGAHLRYELWPDTGYELVNYKTYYCPSCSWSDEQEYYERRNVIRVNEAHQRGGADRG